MSAILRALFRVIVEEAEINEPFRRKLEETLGSIRGLKKNVEAQVRNRPRNRRSAAVIDPYEAMKVGEANLIAVLGPLNIEQLKDVVSQFSMDPSKLALKWKNRERIVDHIVQTTKERLEKGDAFRE